MNLCVVCGRICGPLNGQTKSWRCAGLLANSQRASKTTELLRQSEEIANADRKRFDYEAKNRVRQIILQRARRTKPQVIVDLWGGGLSARLFAQSFPGAEVYSVESAKIRWPALESDAQKYGYRAVEGRLTPWLYAQPNGWIDFIYLDFMASWNRDVASALLALKVKLANTGAFALTLLPARDAFPDNAAREHYRAQEIASYTDCRLEELIKYRQRNGTSPMWLWLGSHNQSRARRGTGTIRFKNGRYQARVSFKWPDGHRRQVSKYARTRAEALAIRDEMALQRKRSPLYISE